MPGTRYKVPRRLRKLFDYHRACDRCAWRGWLRSELTREPQTELLVCPPCLNKPREFLNPELIRPFDGKRVID